jgi:hypothetical protein
MLQQGGFSTGPMDGCWAIRVGLKKANDFSMLQQQTMTSAKLF